MTKHTGTRASPKENSFNKGLQSGFLMISFMVKNHFDSWWDVNLYKKIFSQKCFEMRNMNLQFFESDYWMICIGWQGC